jgi:uncharacterized membrane protein
MLRRTRTMSARRVIMACLALLLLPVGLAHMAVNAVPTTYVGEAEAAVVVPTTLTLDDAKVNVAHDAEYQFLNMKATLLSNGTAVRGAMVTFKVAGVTVCIEETNANGRAICPGNGRFPVDRFEPPAVDPTTYPYTATFAGSGPHQPATGSAHLTKVVGDGP